MIGALDIAHWLSVLLVVLAIGCAHSGQNLAAGETWGNAGRVDPSQRSGTLLAELRSRRVLVLAPGTLHAWASQRAGPGTIGQMARA
jgi:hypothetical protein